MDHNEHVQDDSIESVANVPHNESVDHTTEPHATLRTHIWTGQHAVLVVLVIIFVLVVSVVYDQYRHADNPDIALDDIPLVNDYVTGSGVIANTYQVPREIRACTQDSDCVFVADPFCGTCCTYDAVNAVSQQEYHEQRRIFCAGRPQPEVLCQCEPLGPDEHPFCVQGMCTTAPPGEPPITPYIDDEEPALLFEYRFGVQGMSEHFVVYHDGSWYYSNNLPGGGASVLQAGDAGTLTLEQVTRMRETITSSGVLDIRITQTDETGLVCEGYVSYAVYVDGQRRAYSSPCVDTQTDNTKKVLTVLGEVRDEAIGLVD